MDLERYLEQPIDYSADFTRRMADLGEQLSALLGVPFRQDSDMNYNPGQLLVVNLNAAGEPVAADTGAGWRVTVAVSSRAPLGALLAAVADVEHGAGSAAVTAIARVLTVAGPERVPDKHLYRAALGQVTQMDGAPANLR